MTGFQARIRPEPCLLFGVTISIGGRILDETITQERGDCQIAALFYCGRGAQRRFFLSIQGENGEEFLNL
jgi:hypothetical protein